MVGARIPRRFSLEEYLLLDEASSERNEFLAGAIYAMAGGTIQHAAIATNIVVLLSRLLAGKPCRPYGADLRIYVEAADVATYPDVSVFCGPIRTWKNRSDVATNPTVIVEILSASTQAYDRGEKFETYKRITALKDYVLVEQDKPVVELFSRTPGDVWVPSMVRGLDGQLRIPSLEVALPLGDVFAGVELAAG